MKIKAAVTPGLGEDFKMKELQLPELQPNETLIKIVASGVCHTDATVRDTGMTELPAVLGHEGSGIVEKVGSEVTNVEVGDHVIVSFAVCGSCENCLAGHPAYCENFMTLNFAGQVDQESNELVSGFFGQSSFATHSIAHERNLVKVDKDVDLALLGPLGCGIQTGAGTVLNVLKPEFGSSIVVYGSGAVGLSAIMAAKIAGTKHIIAVDIHDNRLELAKELGATETINSKNIDVVEEVQKITGGGSHYAIDTTGVEPVVLQALEALRPLGKLASVAAMADITIPFMEITGTGKTVMGVTEGDSVAQNFIPELIAYYKNGQFPFDRLVTFFDFDQINEAFAASEDGSAIKPILKMQ